MGTATARRFNLVRARPGSVRRPRLRPPSRRTLVLTSVALVLTVGLAWTFYGTSLLGLRSIEVTGSVIAGPDQVRAVAAVADGTPLARVDTSAVAARVLSLPSVASVDVSRSWPNTLVIAVTERTAVGVVPLPASFLVIAADGVVFNEVPAPPGGVPLLRLSAPGPADPATQAALSVLAALTPQLRAGLIEVVAESPNRIVLRLTDDRAVVWGDARNSGTKATVATALLGTDATTIDVSVPDVATTS